MSLRPDLSDITISHLEQQLADLTAALGSKNSELDAAQRKIMSLKREARRTEEAFNSAVETINVQAARISELEAVLNTPELENFASGVILEAGHQRLRWGSTHDEGKTPADWFWLIGYLAQKALTAHIASDQDKARHHCISTAAAMANWHSAISGEHTDMRPGLSEEATKGL